MAWDKQVPPLMCLINAADEYLAAGKFEQT